MDEENEKLHPKVKKFWRILKKMTREEFINARPIGAGLNVLVTSEDLKENVIKESIARLKLTINEQSMEWASEEGEGDQKDMLLPE